MNFSVEQIIEDPDSFAAYAKGAAEGDLCSLIQRWTLTEMSAMSSAPDALLEKITDALPARALDLLLSKITPTGVRFSPGGKSKFALVSVTNMRWRSVFEMLLVAMISFLYRALSERSRPDASDHFNEHYTVEQADLIRGFLDSQFLYNPSESIDRYTSELYTPAEAKSNATRAKEAKAKETKRTTKADTATIYAHRMPTKIKDRTKAYSPEVSKWYEAERSAAQIVFDLPPPSSKGPSEPISVTVDPPSDIYGHFHRYFETHFDAINKTWVELFLEGRAWESITANESYIYEKVEVYERKPGEKTARLINQLTLPSPSAQWHDAITIYAPANGAFFNTEEQAAEELNKHKGTTIADLRIIHTNATVLTGAWYAGKRNIVTDDPTTQLLFKKLQSDTKIYQSLNKKRVEDAKLREIIQQGLDDGGFETYMKELNPNFSKQALDKQDMEELMAKYREYLSREKIYSNADQNFMLFLTKSLPHRDFNNQPLSLDERKKWSYTYRNASDVPELPRETDLMALDYLIQGDPEHPQPYYRREYTEGMETPINPMS